MQDDVDETRISHVYIIYKLICASLVEERKNRADFYQKTMMMGINIANTKYDGAWGSEFCYWEQRVIVLPIFMYGLITRDSFGHLILYNSTLSHPS